MKSSAELRPAAASSSADYIGTAELAVVFLRRASRINIS